MSNEKDDKQQDEQVPADQTSDEAVADEPEAGAGTEKRRSTEPSGELDLNLRVDDPVFDDEPTDDVVDEATDEPVETEPEGPGGDDVPPAPPYAYEPPRAPLHHRLMRRPEGKVIAGVCSGLGAYTNTDPVLWRIGFVVFGLTSVGVLAYIVAWLVMPEARRGEPLPDRPPHEAAQVTRWAALAAIILGSWVIFRGFFHIGGGWFWGLLLIGIGLAVWGRDLTSGRRPHDDGPPFPPPPRVRPEPWRASQMTTPQTPAGSTPPANPATPSASSESAWPGPRRDAPTTPMPPTSRPRYMATPRPRRRRESSYLGRLVVGACALVIGLGLVLNNTGIIDLTAKGLLAVLVAIIGAGLVTGAWAGRARWLIFPGIALSFALLLASWAPAFARGGFGDIVWQPTSRKALLSTYEHGAGQAVLDLTEVKFDERKRDVEVDLNFGELLIVIPENVPVTSHVHVQGGEINNFTNNVDGWDVASTMSNSGTDEDIGRLTIDAEVAFGEVTVRRERPGDDFTAGSSRGRRDFRFNIGPMRVRGDS